MMCIQIMRPWQVTFVLVVVLLSGCRPGLDSRTIRQFRQNPRAVADFEVANGKVGAFVLPALIADASQYLGLSYADVERAFAADYSEAQIEDGQTVSISEGWNLLSAKQDIGSADINVFDEIEFRNTSSVRAVLVIEGMDVDGSSLGFSYIRLEPGSTYRPGLKSVGRLLTAGRLAAGGIGVIVVTIVLKADEAVAGVGITTCRVARPTVAKNYCMGKCASGACTATTFIGYGPFGVLGKQPNTCACQ